MGALMGRRKASQPPLELIEAGHIKSFVPATECTGWHGRFMEAFCLDLCVFRPAVDY